MQVHEQTSPHLLVKEWMTERSKDGYSIVATQETDGKYTWVMMSKKGMPCTQQTFMVRMLLSQSRPDVMPAWIFFISCLLRCSLKRIGPTSVP